jgi:hypothetical protein
MKKAFTFCLAALIILNFNLYSQNVRWVDIKATGKNTGETPEDAWTGFDQFDINNPAHVPNNTTIYVKPGTYSTADTTADNKTATLWIKNNREITIIGDGVPWENEIILDGGDSVNYGIEIFPHFSPNAVSNIKINNITFQNYKENGIKVRGIAGNPVQYVDTVIIFRCKIIDIKQQAVKIQIAKNIKIKENNITFSGSSDTQTDGIFLSEYCEDVVIESNRIEITNTNTTTNKHIDCLQIAEGENSVMPSKNIVIKNNLLRNNSFNANNYDNRAGMMITGVYDNLSIYNNTIYSIKGDNLIYVRFYAGNDIKIYNNTLIGAGNQQHLMSIQRDSFSVNSNLNSVKIKNNIFYKSGSNTDAIKFVYQIYHNTLSNDILNHNLYYNHNGTSVTPTLKYEGGTSNWNADTSKFEKYGFGGDPHFSDSTEYKLKYFSPAKNRGKSFASEGITTDRLSNKRPYWNADFDLGAFEIADAQLKIGILSNNVNDTISFSIKSFGAYWERNSSNQFALSDNGTLSSSTFKAKADTNTLNWRGWSYAWMHRGGIGDSNKVAGIGFYRISLAADTTKYFYLDARDAIINYSPTVYIRYDLQEEKFEYLKNGTFEGNTIPLGKIIGIWDINSDHTLTNTANLNDYLQNMLLWIKNGVHPRIVWGPYPVSQSEEIDEYKLYREIHENFNDPSLFSLLTTLNNNVFDYTDSTQEMGTGMYSASYNIKANIFNSEEEGFYLSDSTNIVTVRLSDPYKVQSEFEHNQYAYSLSQNYPNPFNPHTRIAFSLASEEHVVIKLYNILGQEVFTILNNNLKPGNYEIKFEASYLSSGIYFYIMTAGNFKDTKKLQLLK